MITKYITTLEGFYELYYTVFSAQHIGFDTEGTMDQLLLMQFCIKDTSFVLDMTKLDHEEVFSKLQYVLESPEFIKVGHNLVYDWRMVRQHGRLQMQGMHDTMTTERMIHAGIRPTVMAKNKPFSLQSVIKRRLGITVDKEIREDFINWTESSFFTNEHIEYSARDAYYPLLIMEQQLQELQDRGLDTKIYPLEMSILEPTAMMEHTGVPIVKETLENLVEPFTRFVKIAEKALQDLFIAAGVCDHIVFTKDGYTAINFSSPKQVKEALHAVGVDVESTDAKIMQRWEMLHRKKKSKDWFIEYHTIIDDDQVADALDEYKKFENPYLRSLAFYKGASILLNTFILGMLHSINPKTNRIHPYFNSYGADRTGRYSSNGPNFQNLPNDDKLAILGLKNLSIREAIESALGRKLVIADYAGIELVILAALSSDTKLMDAIFIGDVHTMVTREVLKYTLITKENKALQPHKKWRDAAKTMSYAIAYGTTGRNLSETLNIRLSSEGFRCTPKEADQLIQDWYKLFPDTAAYLESNARKAVVDGYVTDTWGRRRNWDRSTFIDKWKRLAAGREGMNMPIQGTSATMTKRAIRLIWERLNQNKARMIITVHDEIVTESIDSYTEEAVRIIKESMEQAIRETLPSVADVVGKYEGTSVFPKISQKYDK